MAKKQKIIFGIDEVGRGSLAASVFAAAIFSPKIKNLKFRIKNYFGIIGDSKQLTPQRRENIYKFLCRSTEVYWRIGRVSEKFIDKINIFEATKLAMAKAVKSLEKKIDKKADLLLIDGNFGIGMTREQKSIIRGDEKIFLISLASIVAKVERDRLMLRLHKKYPRYGFDKHKGYGTELHLERLKKFGPCKIHRQSFEPIKSIFGRV